MCERILFWNFLNIDVWFEPLFAFGSEFKFLVNFFWYFNNMKLDLQTIKFVEIFNLFVKITICFNWISQWERKRGSTASLRLHASYSSQSPRDLFTPDHRQYGHNRPHRCQCGERKAWLLLVSPCYQTKEERCHSFQARPPLFFSVPLLLLRHCLSFAPLSIIWEAAEPW